MKFKIYDYKNSAIEIDTGDKSINFITVTILSGDETGLVVFEYGTTQAFDASKCRCTSHFEGQYVVLGSQVEKWASIKPYVSKCRYETKSCKRANVWRKLTCPSN